MGFREVAVSIARPVSSRFAQNLPRNACAVGIRVVRFIFSRFSEPRPIRRTKPGRFCPCQPLGQCPSASVSAVFFGIELRLVVFERSFLFLQNGIKKSSLARKSTALCGLNGSNPQPYSENHGFSRSRCEYCSPSFQQICLEMLMLTIYIGIRVACFVFLRFSEPGPIRRTTNGRILPCLPLSQCSSAASFFLVLANQGPSEEGNLGDSVRVSPLANVCRPPSDLSLSESDFAELYFKDHLFPYKMVSKGRV